MKINLINNNGHAVSAPVGFSFTYLFFGSFVPLLRGDMKWFFITLLLAVFTLGFSQFVFIFIYNGLYIKSMLMKGYKPADDFSLNVLRSKGVVL